LIEPGNSLNTLLFFCSQSLYPVARRSNRQITYFGNETAPEESNINNPG